MNASTPENWPSGAGVQRRTSSENSTTNPPIAITEAGANFAEIRPRSIVLMTIDPIAMPTEKIAMTRLATRSSAVRRSEEHTSELQSLMRSSYAVFCLKKKNNTERQIDHHNID